MPHKNRHSRSVVKHWKKEKEHGNCLWHLMLSDSSGDSDNSERTVLSAVIPCPWSVPCSSTPLWEASPGSLALTVSHVEGPPVPHAAPPASDAGFLTLQESTLSLSGICLRKTLVPDADFTVARWVNFMNLYTDVIDALLATRTCSECGTGLGLKVVCNQVHVLASATITCECENLPTHKSTRVGGLDGKLSYYLNRNVSMVYGFLTSGIGYAGCCTVCRASFFF